MTELILHGSEYIDPRWLNPSNVNRKEDWADVPVSLRVTEARVRAAGGASDPKWLKRHLTWRGCGAAVPFGADLLWLPCTNEGLPNGYCKRHKGRARA